MSSASAGEHSLDVVNDVLVVVVVVVVATLEARVKYPFPARKDSRP